jgi:transcription elongation factor Elf1
MSFLKVPRLRSEKHRRNVASLDCVVCGRQGPSQCAHANFGKGLSLKACDSQTFAACPYCHQIHDQSGIEKQKRRALEVVYVDRTRDQLIERGLWTPEIERHYRAAYTPMRRAA